MEEEKDRRNKEKTNNKMVGLNPNISMTTLNINYLNKSIKRKIVIMDKKIPRSSYMFPIGKIFQI